jgi:2-polyprenyl-6-hydroxyphenyl methylase/3-demethylubiquinone-9 3-methyltransferase
LYFVALAAAKAITDPNPAAARRAFDWVMQMKKIDIATIEAARRGRVLGADD